MAEQNTRRIRKKLDDLKKQLECVVNLSDEYSGITFKGFKKIYLEELALYREPNTVIAHETGLKAFSDLNDKLMIDIEFLDIKKL